MVAFVHKAIIVCCRGNFKLTSINFPGLVNSLWVTQSKLGSGGSLEGIHQSLEQLLTCLGELGCRHLLCMNPNSLQGLFFLPRLIRSLYIFTPRAKKPVADVVFPNTDSDCRCITKKCSLHRREKVLLVNLPTKEGLSPTVNCHRKFLAVCQCC